MRLEQAVVFGRIFRHLGLSRTHPSRGPARATPAPRLG
jgi:hypothetical protein